MGRKIARIGGRLLVGLGLAIVLVVVAFAVDQLIHRNRVGRNVSLAGYVVADGDTEDIARVIRAEWGQLADLPVTIRSAGVSIETTLRESGIVIDEPAVVEAALNARSEGGLLGRFRGWVQSLTGEVDVPLAYTVDDATTRNFIDSHPRRVIQHLQEPAFTGAGGGLQVAEARDGLYIDSDSLVEAMRAVVTVGPPPYTIDVEPARIPTTHTQANLEAALAQADYLADRLVVSVNGTPGLVGAESVRRWIDSAVVEGQLVPVFNSDRVDASLAALFSHLADPLPEPRFSVDGGELHIDLGIPARTCCAPGVAPLLYDAAREDVTHAVELPTIRVEDDGGAGRAAEYGITELVSSFTTKHSCCQNRVTNIHRIADLVRGQIIRPGETFSINDFIGRRTRENGFVADGAIQSGHFTDQVGGGISQFATTTFNVAFFAGLDIPEYQSHSIYIDRYPYGREATLSFPLPDLELTNNTPYAVMLWTSYTDTSITVEVWSTKHFEVEQTRQTSYKIGSCTRVNTYRERTAPDGTVLEDFFIATYRPGQGLDCNGNRTPDPDE